jgi:hypothetical protein
MLSRRSAMSSVIQSAPHWERRDVSDDDYTESKISGKSSRAGAFLSATIGTGFNLQGIHGFLRVRKSGSYFAQFNLCGNYTAKKQPCDSLPQGCTIHYSLNSWF